MNWFEGFFFSAIIEKKSLLRYLEIKLCMRLATHRTTTTTSTVVIKFFNFFFVETALSFHGILNYTHTLHEEKFEKYKKYKS